MTYETMAATAYILITCDSGDEGHIIRALSQTSGITECSVLDGPYNMIIKMDADDMDKLDEVVAGKLKQIDKISSMLTLKQIQ
jgi:DNA-binding Lrp family transcriptional regulator